MKNIKDVSGNAATAKSEANDLASRIQHFGEDARDAAERVGTKARKFYDENRERANEALDDFSTSVRAHPVKSTLIAAAVGYVLGRLLSR